MGWWGQCRAHQRPAHYLFAASAQEVGRRNRQLSISVRWSRGVASGEDGGQNEKLDGVPQFKSHRDSPIWQHYEDSSVAFLAHQFLALLNCSRCRDSSLMLG